MHCIRQSSFNFQNKGTLLAVFTDVGPTLGCLVGLSVICVGRCRSVIRKQFRFVLSCCPTDYLLLASGKKNTYSVRGYIRRHIAGGCPKNGIWGFLPTRRIHHKGDYKSIHFIPLSFPQFLTGIFPNCVCKTKRSYHHP